MYNYLTGLRKDKLHPEEKITAPAPFTIGEVDPSEKVINPLRAQLLETEKEAWSYMESIS